MKVITGEELLKMAATEEDQYRLEFSENQQCFHLERIDSGREEGSYGWQTISTGKDFVLTLFICWQNDFKGDVHIKAKQVKKNWYYFINRLENCFK